MLTPTRDGSEGLAQDRCPPNPLTKGQMPNYCGTIAGLTSEGACGASERLDPSQRLRRALRGLQWRSP